MNWRVTRRFHWALWPYVNVVGSLVMKSKFASHLLWFVICENITLSKAISLFFSLCSLLLQKEEEFPFCDIAPERKLCSKCLSSFSIEHKYGFFITGQSFLPSFTCMIDQKLFSVLVPLFNAVPFYQKNSRLAILLHPHQKGSFLDVLIILYIINICYHL